MANIELGAARGETVLGRRRYELEPMTLGAARIILTDGVNVESFWHYESPAAAMAGWQGWRGGDGEPGGYSRSQHNRAARRL